MNIVQKGWNVKLTFQREDWNRTERSARDIIAKMKMIGAKYYASDKSWNMKNTMETRELIDWIRSGPDHDNRVDLTGTEHYGQEFVAQFDKP